MTNLLIDIACRSGCSDSQAFEGVLKSAVQRQQSLVADVLDSGLVDEECFIRELAQDLGMEWLENIPFAEDGLPLREACGQRTALLHHLLPVALNGEVGDKRLKLATFDPFDLVARQAAVQEIALPIDWCIASRKRLKDGIIRCYGTCADTFDSTCNSSPSPALKSRFLPVPARPHPTKFTDSNDNPDPRLRWIFRGLLCLAIIAFLSVIVWQSNQHPRRSTEGPEIPPIPLAGPPASSPVGGPPVYGPKAKSPYVALPQLEPVVRQSVPMQDSRSGRLTVESWNSLIVGEFIKQGGQRGVRRRQSFSGTDWPEGKKLVRVEQDNVPILGAPKLNVPRLDVIGVCNAGEVLSLFDQQSSTALLVNPLSRAPDESGLWYRVGTLDGKQGWVFADPVGHQGSPIARSCEDRNGELVEARGQFGEKQNSGTLAMVDAHARGAEAGYYDGKQAGFAEVFDNAVKTAFKDSFNKTIGMFYASGNYNTTTFYTFVAVGGGGLLGFCLQYAALLLIRKCGSLRHIDPIILGNLAKEAELGALVVPSVHPNPMGKSGGNSFLLPLFAIFIILMMGCENREKEAYKKAYDAQYDAAKQVGRQKGAESGNRLGMEKGTVAAKEAAESGLAWQLYTNVAIVWLILGAVEGLLTQYIVLFACRLSGRMQRMFIAYFSHDYSVLVLDSAAPGLFGRLTVPFVPAMGSSISYSICQQLRGLLASAKNTLETETVAARGKYAGRHLLVALATRELDKVISDSDELANATKEQPINQ